MPARKVRSDKEELGKGKPEAPMSDIRCRMPGNEILVWSAVVTDHRRWGFIDETNAPESLKQRILNGVE